MDSRHWPLKPLLGNSEGDPHARRKAGTLHWVDKLTEDGEGSSV